MYDRILVPTDGSEQRPVVEHALDLAELTGAAVHALYVVDRKALDYQPSKEGREEARERRREEGGEATDEIARQGAERSVEVVTAVEEGDPASVIGEYADDRDVDLIVMGTQGRSGVDRYVLGSVTERVVRASDVPVLTVNLARQGRAVRDDETARERARRALEDEGHVVAEFPEEPYRESNTWLVRARTEAGEAFNVHIDAGTGEARVARIRR